jgi:2',3'-cyclic-nucleotide 2'-phosphodiesterase (5'-nucleotidase family)
MKAKCLLLLGALLAATLATAQAATAHLLILHTNDLHDHVRAGSNGLGGLPYVAGYIQQARAGRSDVLVLDAGDVTEKGDLVAFRTHGVMTYEAMSRVGYDAVALGNHDIDEISAEQVQAFEQALGQPILCLNIVRPDGAPRFTPSRIVERGGIKVGLIGLITPRKPEDGGLDATESGRALQREAARLRAAGAELIVAICHESAPKCAEWSQLAPEVNVFVSGHAHQAIQEPLVVPQTGALIVQAGSYARWVGELEIEFDRDARRVVQHGGKLIAMQHASTPVDAAMLAWVQETEKRLAPEAADFVFDNPAQIDGFAVARLGAEALRVAAGADVGFCHPYQIIREVLPAGRIDVNAVFQTGGHRGHDTLLVSLTGREIEAYVNALQRIQREPPEWAGFRVARVSAPDGGERYQADLEPERSYRVVMPKLEWDTRFLRLAQKVGERDPRHPLASRRFTTQPSDVTFTSAVCAYIQRLVADGATVQGRIKELERRREKNP